MASKWFVVPVPGDGNCLFSSLACGNFIYTLLHSSSATPTLTPAPRPLLPLSREAIGRAAQVIRASVVEWYASRPDVPAPGDELLHARGDSRLVMRSDILATYAPDVLGLTMNVEVPEALDSPLRRMSLARYLHAMAKSGTWGTTPEWQAYAHMSGLPVVCYVAEPIFVQPSALPDPAVDPATTKAVVEPPQLKPVAFNIALRLKAIPHDAIVATPADLESVEPSELTEDKFKGFAVRLLHQPTTNHYSLLLTAHEALQLITMGYDTHGIPILRLDIYLGVPA